MIKIGICDDVKTQREELKRLCINWASTKMPIDVACYKSASEILHDCEEFSGNFDIIFMDVEFSDGVNGVDAVKEINELLPDCKIIYVTAYSKYATDVYETNHAYLVLKNKDISENVFKALDKALECLESERSDLLAIRSKGINLIPIRDIVSFERDKRVTVLHTLMGDISTYEPFDELLEKVKDKKIIRCHKSYAVNFYHVSKYTRVKFIMDNEENIPISRAYQKEIFDSFTDYLDDSLVIPIGINE